MEFGRGSTSYQPRLHAMASTDSRQKSVVLLKACKGSDDPYDVAFQAAGYAPHFVPVLHFEYINGDQLSTALTNPNTYSGLIFSSQTAVDASYNALSTHSSPDWRERLAAHWKDLPTFAVGKATSQAVWDKFGLKTSGSVSGNAEALSKVIIEHYRDTEKSTMKPLLFPCSVLRRETLPSAMDKAGIPLQCLPSYNTIADPNIARNIQVLFQALPDEVWVVYFSPSGVSFAHEHVNSILKHHKVAAIGPTTSEALAKNGVKVDVSASKPNAESLAQAIVASTTPS